MIWFIFRAAAATATATAATADVAATTAAAAVGEYLNDSFEYAFLEQSNGEGCVMPWLSKRIDNRITVRP